MAGPLTGIKIIEFAGIGPGPFCGMMLADHGAEVIRIERPGGMRLPHDPLARNRRSICLDMKNADAIAIARDLCRSADAIIEGYRPGVMERLGLGPDVLLADNPALVYGRMTGWGQHGPYAPSAGHDINYIALSGVLHTIGRAGEKPVPPVNYVGDFGGGGMMLAYGMVSAILAVKMGGKGQVIDCAMTDGSALLSAMTWGFRALGVWQDQAGVNRLDGGAPYYDTYVCADGKYVSIGSIEPQFYALLRQKTGLDADADFDAQDDAARWPLLKQKLTTLFASQPRDHWCALMEGSDVCFAPVLSMAEAPQHPHNAARQTFIEVDGATMPAPAPRYSGTPNAHPKGAGPKGAEGDAILGEIGYDAARIAALRTNGAMQ
ncbi:MAG: CoA transferase [Sphingomonadaceae bacterium]|nr:CoA transferase [Sphingomonadaceae bacterium]